MSHKELLLVFSKKRGGGIAWSLERLLNCGWWQGQSFEGKLPGTREELGEFIALAYWSSGQPTLCWAKPVVGMR